VYILFRAIFPDIFDFECTAFVIELDTLSTAVEERSNSLKRNPEDTRIVTVTMPGKERIDSKPKHETGGLYYRYNDSFNNLC
jgi:hypothetical protein